MRLVKGDRIQLQQVVMNLVVNAIEAIASTSGTRRMLKASSDSLESGAVRVDIEDTDIGIDPQSAQRILEPFETTKRAGMGMGLLICRTVVAAHRGELIALAREGGGTIFVSRYRAGASLCHTPDTEGCIPLSLDVIDGPTDCAWRRTLHEALR